MDWRIMGLDSSMLSALHDMIDMYEEPKTQQPSRAYVRDHKAMNATQADVKEYPNSYVFLVDMPGLKPDQIKVQIEEPNMLVVFGERKHEKEKDEKEGDGVLTVTVEKKPLPEPKKAKSIESKLVDKLLIHGYGGYGGSGIYVN
ncbi:17.9 kDa class II heat shock protein [Vitis vinifera]|uniref:17.9 kDa class II heat shock protein n=1 Tax=Vitis vinifera TaxID=29760 RepID=A0A438K8Z0_VITVI|nr:17.9 kDa class II heat shock protein [Vitis vinifera]